MEKTQTDVIWLRANEVRSILKISQSALHAYVKSGFLKSYKMGSRTLRFKESDVLQIIQPNKTNG